MKSLLCRCAPLLLAGIALVGCDRMVTPRADQAVKDAQRKASDGDYLHAVGLYENALDGSPQSADIHYQLGLLYDDKMSDPLNALHHFKRYLVLSPTGAHAAEVKGFMKRDELALVTTLSGDSLLTRSAATELRNENLRLRQQLEAKSVAMAAKAEPASKRGERRGKSGPPRSHVVQPGDTLFSLSRLYYNSPDRWKDILKANRHAVEDPAKLKVGQTLTIP
ncbi:MAG: LysM peptidoglycan-binding domain-containing protein [Chthoniobacterales bacterium]